MLQYKFIVDGEWKYAPDQPAMHDERDIINNVVEVQEYVPDHLDSLVGFEPPPSPVERCLPVAPCCEPRVTAELQPHRRAQQVHTARLLPCTPACAGGGGSKSCGCSCCCSYNNPRQVAEDFAKDPPAMPPHLQLTLLNVPPATDATASLPRPQHVILNHLYCQRNSRSINAAVRSRQGLSARSWQDALTCMWCQNLG